jgi:hypothetical protein
MDDRRTAIGTMFDIGGTTFSFLDARALANLQSRMAEDQIKRGEEISATAGEGATERIETERAQKGAVARDVLRDAATQAVMDPTGAGAAEFARQSTQMVKGAMDTSDTATEEAAAELEQKKLGEEIISKGEQKALAAKHGKARGRLQAVKGIIDAVQTGVAALKPESYEASLEGKIKRTEGKQTRLQKRQRNLQRKQMELTEGRREGTLTERQNEGIDDRLKAIKEKREKLKKKEVSAGLDTSDHKLKMQALRRAKLKELQMLYGGTLSDTLKPGISTETSTETPKE